MRVIVPHKKYMMMVNFVWMIAYVTRAGPP